MNDIKLFNYNNNQIRVIEKDGAAWFVANDVCNVLGLKNPRKALQGLDEDELMYLRVTSGGQKREINGVSESGLYNLIFKSNKSEAKQFRRWVTHEVLPDIHKYGMYLGDKARETALADPETFNAVVQAYTQEKEKVKALTEYIDQNRQFTNLGYLVAGLPGSFTIAEAANLFAQRGVEIGRNRLYKMGRDMGLLSKQKGHRNKPTQKGIEGGFFCLEVDPTDNTKLTMRTLLTKKGLDLLVSQRLKEELPLIYLFEQTEEEEREAEAS